MAFSKDKFLPLFGTLNDNMPQIWVLSDNTAIATLDTSGYFPNQLTSTALGVKDGDLLLYYNTALKTWNAHTFIYVVATGVLDVADGTVIGSATNTD